MRVWYHPIVPIPVLSPRWSRHDVVWGSLSTIGGASHMATLAATAEAAASNSGKRIRTLSLPMQPRGQVLPFHETTRVPAS